MPKQSGQSSLFARYGEKARQAWTKHRADETRYGGGGGDLPEGIEMGVAQLVDCEFGKFKQGPNTGEHYFRAAGIVVSPKEHNGVPIEGLRTQIGPEPVCDTPKSGGKRKTAEDHWDWVANEMRKLAGDEAVATSDDPESLAAAIKEAAPYFRFRTWKGAKQTEGPYKDREPRVQHEWRGACDWNGEAVIGAVQDETEEAAVGEAVEEEATEDVPFGDDLDMLADRADKRDKKAVAEIRQRAKDVGLPDEAVDNADNYNAVAGLIRAVAVEQPEESEEAEEESSEFKPAKEDVAFYKPPGKRKSIEVEITAVFEASKKVNLKNLEDGKTLYKSIPWSSLSSEA